MNQAIEALVIAELAPLGYELVELRQGGSKGRPVLDVRIDRAQAANTNCTYKVQSVAGEYEATLVVTDAGSTGVIDPVLGTYCDQKSSTPAIRKVRVAPLQ